MNVIEEALKDQTTAMEMACENHHAAGKDFAFTFKCAVDVTGKFKMDTAFKPGETVKQTYEIPTAA